MGDPTQPLLLSLLSYLRFCVLGATRKSFWVLFIARTPTFRRGKGGGGRKTKKNNPTKCQRVQNGLRERAQRHHEAQQPRDPRDLHLAELSCTSARAKARAGAQARCGRERPGASRSPPSICTSLDRQLRSLLFHPLYPKNRSQQ